MTIVRSHILPALLLGLLAAGALAVVGRADDAKERAAASLEQSLKSDPQNAELWVHLGFAYRKLERLDPAREAFEKAASLDAKNQEAWYMLGLIYEKQQKGQDALRAWRSYLAVVTDPEKRATAESHIHHLSQ